MELAASRAPLLENRANASHLYAGTFLVLLAVVFLTSLIIAEGFVTLLLVFLYSNLIPSLAVLLGYHLLRGGQEPAQNQVRPSELFLILLISTFGLPIVTFYYIPLAVASIVLVIHASKSSSSGILSKGPGRLALVGMLLWPSVMIGILVLSLLGLGSSFNALFVGVALTWAVVAFEIGILGLGRGAGEERKERQFRASGRSEHLPLLTSVGMSLLTFSLIWVEQVPDFGLQNQLLRTLTLTAPMSLGITGLSNLLVVTYHRFGPRRDAGGR